MAHGLHMLLADYEGKGLLPISGGKNSCPLANAMQWPSRDFFALPFMGISSRPNWAHTGAEQNTNAPEQEEKGREMWGSRWKISGQPAAGIFRCFLHFLARLIFAQGSNIFPSGGPHPFPLGLQFPRMALSRVSGRTSPLLCVLVGALLGSRRSLVGTGVEGGPCPIGHDHGFLFSPKFN
jgi:hypothetical protein